MRKPTWGQRPDMVLRSPRAQLQRVIWPLATVFPVVGAALQWWAGYPQNLLHDAVLLALVLLSWRLDVWRQGWGQALFLLGLAPLVIWLVVAPGLGPKTLTDFAGYSAVLLLPTALAAVRFGSAGVLGFALYGLLVGWVGLRPGSGEGMGAAWHTATALLVGWTLAWLLDQTDQVYRRLERAALSDLLTGLGNRRAFEVALAAEWKAAPAQVGILVIDLDGLKQINDLRGHASGDALLRQFAAALLERVPQSHRVFRLGGDEYVVLCPAGCLAGLGGVVRGAVDAVQRLGFPEVDASAGAAHGGEVPGPSALLGLADQRMYREKHAKPPRSRQTQQPQQMQQTQRIQPFLRPFLPLPDAVHHVLRNDE